MVLEYVAQTACLAFGVAGYAGVSAMKDEPVVGNGDEVSWNLAGKLHLYAIGSGATGWYQSYAVAHTEDVRVYGKSGLSPYDGLHHIGGLAPYAGQTYELV